MKQICTIRVPQKQRDVFLSEPKWNTTPCSKKKGYWSTQVIKLKKKLDLPLYHKKWQKYKEYGNKYERIYNTHYQYTNYNVALCSPLSRSYFKLWEIIHDFQLLNDNQSSIQTAHLAEGPGGFIESVCDYRKKNTPREHVQSDLYYGITLLTYCHDDTPNWKKAEQLMETYPQISLHTGKDKTGDLYNVDNIHAFVADIGRHSCSLVTGDGGMDYSHNYVKQEELSQRLILAQIYTALLLVKTGKHFVCKLFDTHEQFTQELLWILSVCFDVVHIIKPYTSRVANSERYVISCGFRECPSHIETYLNQLLLNWKATMFIDSIFSKPLPIPFVKALHKYSEWHSKQQFMSIHKCYHLIETNRYSKKKSNEMLEIMKHQEKDAQRWCKKYKIPYRKETST